MLTPKLPHKIGLSALAIVVAMFIAGFVYVYINDSSASQSKNLDKADTAQYEPIKPPPKPGPNAAVGVAEEAFDSPVAPGEDTSIIINTTPDATCSISVSYNGVKSTDPALAPQKADDFGVVTWSWNVPSTTPFGEWPVDVTCRLGAHWAVYDDYLVVKQ